VTCLEPDDTNQLLTFCFLNIYFKITLPSALWSSKLSRQGRKE
jgi:hypothetical protein